MRILLVEDEKNVAEFIARGLREEHYTVDVVTSGSEGASLAVESQYDLVILDIMLPDIDGIEVCRRVRSAGLATPVLMLTARDSVRDKISGLDSGADDYLTKPFSFDEFLARVRALLRRRSTEMTTLTYRDLRIDVPAHKAFVGAHEIILRPKEFSILEYLLRNKGRVLSRTRILENIWGYNFDPTTNIVDVHIKALREKIARFGKGEYVRTVRGIGYAVDND